MQQVKVESSTRQVGEVDLGTFPAGKHWQPKTVDCSEARVAAKVWDHGVGAEQGFPQGKDS